MVVPSSGHWRDGGSDGPGAVERRLDEALAAEAGVAFAAVRVEDSEGRPATRRSGPVAGDDHLRSLADDVAPEAQPRSASELEPDPGGLSDGRGDRRDEARGLEDDEADARPPGERREPAEAVGHASGAREAWRQVDDEQVDGPAGEERAGDREALLRVGRGQDHEPLRPDATGDGLDRVEGLRQVEPGRDRARGLGLRDEPQGERRPPAREVTPERQAEATRQAARPEDRVESREPGRMDTSRVRLGARPDARLVIGLLERHGGEGPHDLADPCRSEHRRRGRTPLRPEGRQGRRHIGGGCRHRRIIEQMFE
jgi:hypothetical protein